MFKVAQNLCQQLSTFDMRDFNKGIEVLQSEASLWDGGKKVFVWEATGITIQYSSMQYIMLLSLCLLRYSHLVFPHFDDDVPSESDNKSESDTHIKVPPPPPPTDKGTK